jgi:hypothetical protein
MSAPTVNPPTILRPSFERVCLAFAVAPPSAAVPVFVFYAALLAPYVRSDNVGGWLVGPGGFALLAGAFAYPITLVLAVPTYLAARALLRLTPLRAAAIGGGLGVLVISGLLALAAPELKAGLFLGGLIGEWHLVALGFAAGALPGLAFWTIATRPERKVR